MASTQCPIEVTSAYAMISVLPQIILCTSRLSEESNAPPTFRDGVALTTGATYILSPSKFKIDPWDPLT